MKIIVHVIMLILAIVVGVIAESILINRPKEKVTLKGLGFTIGLLFVGFEVIYWINIIISK